MVEIIVGSIPTVLFMAAVLSRIWANALTPLDGGWGESHVSLMDKETLDVDETNK